GEATGVDGHALFDHRLDLAVDCQVAGEPFLAHVGEAATSGRHGDARAIERQRCLESLAIDSGGAEDVYEAGPGFARHGVHHYQRAGAVGGLVVGVELFIQVHQPVTGFGLCDFDHGVPPC